MQYYKKYPLKSWVYETIRGHKRKGHIINISRDKLIQIARETKDCSICGVKLKWHYEKGYKNNSPTLDRIDNEQEINEFNIQIVCRRCNTTKYDRTMQEFVRYCEKVWKKFIGYTIDW